MAILPDLKGVEVKVLISGIPAREYADDDIEVKPDELSQYQASKTISKYIEVSTDDEYAIELSVNRHYKFDCEALSFEVYVDGKTLRSPILRRGSLCITSGWKHSIEGVKSHNGPEWMLRRFKFAAIETTMDDDKMHDITEDAQHMSKVGEIEVWVYRKSDVQQNKIIDDCDTLTEHDAVHEKALKGQAKSHGTFLGDAQATEAIKQFSSKKIDGEGRPIAIYKFKYRSREALESLLIVSRTPDFERPPAPTPSCARRHYTVKDPDPAPLLAMDIDLDTATSTEKQLMAAYLAGLRRSSSRVKSEQDIKRERGAAGGSRKKVKQEDDVVVDLTTEV